MSAPQPIDVFPTERLRKIDSVVFDVDNTVTSHHQLSPQAYRALCELADAGFTLVAASGRPLGWCDVWAAQWPIECAIGENGAGWVRVQDGFRVEGYVDSELVRVAFQQRGREIIAAVERELPHISMTQDHHARRCDVSFDIGERSQATPADVQRLAEIIRAHGAQAIMSSVHAHAAELHWDKAHGVAHAMHNLLKRDLAEELERWAFVGDSPNDDGAFGYFPNSVAVANVRKYLPSLRHQPAFVTRADDGIGFAEFAQLLLKQARQ